MLDPVRLCSVVALLRKQFGDRMSLTPRDEAGVLREMTESDARLDRLRERRKGDPDFESDELQMAIDWARTKPRHLLAPALPDGGMTDVLSMLVASRLCS